ncbi:hypothetical protein L211DRAFT_802321 [Terfezia boudieri ATCC MYA-4762]|uniref:Uncharacterized protein n=1 Tax=Terfezia boudieri ATCC MYA-4762 TaxID=1051890 RepID=A0A3N4LV08_9PEZI|nr:hypothetical protein L211DRAFT_804274 [Terfezia boudieri ATCC MYA-4762]RPB28746.1 hypothetical protein L211DRAFT_802321 [Terfezia boudieri ATCC MYA-4762]
MPERPMPEPQHNTHTTTQSTQHNQRNIRSTITIVIRTPEMSQQDPVTISPAWSPDPCLDPSLLPAVLTICS